MTDDFTNQALDFTESEYRKLLRLAKRSWRFGTFSQTDLAERSILWRHDIDFSPHRALALAAIEADEGVVATYFVLFHSDFYNALEREVTTIITRIVAYGHRIGLHFDPSFYDDRESLDPLLAKERALLESIAGASVDAFSWHIPSVGRQSAVESNFVAGMVNAYGPLIRAKFSYISDSHGIWRFRRLRTVLEEASEPHLHVLTHPEWWVPSVMAPRSRVLRAIEGRAAAAIRRYDALLERMDRPNVREEPPVG